MASSLNEQTIALPDGLMREVARAQAAWRDSGNTRRFWNADAALWSGHDESNWLGWLDIVDTKSGDLDVMLELALRLRAENFADVLLLGMGGSSLGPEVLAQILGSASGYPKLHVLDSTDPHQVRRFERSVDIARTLFIVSSKSGTTLETSVLMDYFFAKASAALGSAAGRHFVAITDPGSRLGKMAKEKGFHHVFLGVPSIGGRYSVLSNFGMVPLAACGHDPRGFLSGTQIMTQACRLDTPAENPGVALGLVIGVLAREGHDKITIVAPPSLAAFGAWAEQLLAESMGKNGQGVIPIVGESLGDPSAYGADRLFVFLRAADRDSAQLQRAAEALVRAGHPVVSIDVASPQLLGQEFFRFEIATAVGGAVLGINPFDQPDVEASKIAAREITDVFETTGSLPSSPPVLVEDGIAIYADERNAKDLRRIGAGSALESWLKAHFAQLRGGDYFAILAYVDARDTRVHVLQRLRAAVRDRWRVATCLQFGPRFLHSTGQAYKGGPNSGVFLQITGDPSPDLEIPGRTASFGVIELAQARGDFRVLGERGRRALHAHIAGNLDEGLAAIAEAARRALQ